MATRRHTQTALTALLGSPDDVRADAVEERMNGRRPKRWRKFPDAPLGAIVDGALQHRAQKGTAEAESAAARLRSVRSRFDRMAPSDNPLLPPAMVRRFRASLAEDDETDCA